ncbi:hypothetical protein Q8A50_04925 [Leuconostoc mesenteroides]|nr:hypothetical protein [Leuconostoc mesenteroides]MDP0486904.1 hypothetical protein [Leuconostoc mesenteroides]TDV91757.1 hypothetical protein C7818_107100 [Leuconostoc mesenteroides]WMS38860.1 hypothetical protein Q8F54_05460 [Leuconostoc mesenteroides]
MGQLLSKLGRWIYRHAKLTIVAFFITIAVSVGAALSFGIHFDSAGCLFRGHSLKELIN